MKMIAMKCLLRPLLSAAFAGLLVATASIPSDAARRAPARTSYDGVWSVAIYTTARRLRSRRSCRGAHQRRPRVGR